MKKVFLMILTCTALFVGCQKEDPAPKKVDVSSIAFEKQTMTVGVGAKGTNAVTINPQDATDKTLAFTTSDASVATVDAASGEVTGVKIGSATITAKSISNPTVTATFTVNVTKYVASITIPKQNGYTYVGATLTIQPVIIAPDDAVERHLEWTSSAQAVATVDETGVVTALSAGTTKITAKSKDGSEISASVDITVKAVPTIDDPYVGILLCSGDKQDGWGTGKDKSVSPAVPFEFTTTENKGGVIDNTDFLTGTGSYKITPLSSTSSYYNHFWKRWSTSFSIASIPVEKRYIIVNLYVSDATKLGHDANGQIELCSGGDADKKELRWVFSDFNLVNGWNRIALPFSTATKDNDFDESSINYCRVYYYESNTETNRRDNGFTMKLDQIRIVNIDDIVKFEPCETEFILKNKTLSHAKFYTELDNADKKEGNASVVVKDIPLEGSIACFRFVYTGDYAKYAFKNPLGLNLKNAQVGFWLYVSDAAKINQCSGIRLEMTSSGTNDSKGFDFLFREAAGTWKALTDGWNYLSMPFDAASCTKSEGADINNINYIRFMFEGLPSGNYTVKLDDIAISMMAD